MRPWGFLTAHGRAVGTMATAGLLPIGKVHFEQLILKSFLPASSFDNLLIKKKTVKTVFFKTNKKKSQMSLRKEFMGIFFTA